LKKAFGSERVDRFVGVAVFGSGEVQGQDRPAAAAFERLLVVAGVGQEVLARGQQKGPELSPGQVEIGVSSFIAYKQ
jgi:hypothetical protein